ncbi:MAG: MMPL family transporter, partial [Thermodesulfobacteriota bacterium]|nr:MMPL family transporter [Thermodesulfobacteriota bacterium]
LMYCPVPKIREDLEKDEGQKRGILKLIGEKTYEFTVKGMHMTSGSKARWVTMAFVILVLVGGGYWTTATLKIGDSSAGGAILYPDHPYNIAASKANNDYVGSSQLVIIVNGKEKFAIKDRRSLETMEKLGLFMKQKIENVGGTLSIADMIRRIFRMYHEGCPKWEMIPQRKATLGKIMYGMATKYTREEFSRYVTIPDYTNSSVTAFLRNYSPGVIKDAIAQVKEFAQEVDNDEESLIRLRVAAGILGILAAVNEEVEWSYWATLIVIFSATFLLCLIGYRSFKSAVILIIPLLMSQVLCQIIMLLLHIELNINTLPIAAIGAGVGIDYGIYLLSRLREECATATTFEEASFVSLTTAGKPIMFTALTLTLGVVFWLWSTLKFQAIMGLLIMFLMILNMVVALVVIPALTVIIKPGFVKEMGKEVKS